MKLRELAYLVGIRPPPQRYAFTIETFHLSDDGDVEYAQWLHPSETRKAIRQSAVTELRKFIAPGDVAIDIGAHTGDTAIPMALAAGASGCVLALEPNPYVFPVLEQNAKLNPAKTRIVPLMIAATREAGDVEFQYSDAGFCNGGRHDGISRWRHGHAFTLRVRGENLESYLAEHFPTLTRKVRFVKVDAEGSDYDVLASIRHLLAAQKPFVRAEVYKLLARSERERLHDLVVELGYDVFVVDGEDRYVGAKLDRRQLMARPHYDIFCIPSS